MLVVVVLVVLVVLVVVVVVEPAVGSLPPRDREATPPGALATPVFASGAALPEGPPCRLLRDDCAVALPET